MSRDYKTHPMTREEYRLSWVKPLRDALAVISYARRMRKRPSCQGVAWDTYWAAEHSANETASVALHQAGGLLGEW